MDKFMQEYTKNQSRGYYARFWANTASANGLTVKYDGKEFLVKLEDIYMEDLGGLFGKCLCGHAIRYQYHVGPVTPIGSTCISTMTGLTGQDLRMIIKGGELATKDKEELIRTITHYTTLKKQLEEDKILAERLDFIHKLDIIPEVVQKFIEEDVPFPNPIKSIVYKIYNENSKVLKVKQMFGQEVFDMMQSYEDVVRVYRNQKELPKFCSTILDIGRKIADQKANQKQIEFFKTLYNRAKNARQIDAFSILLKLSQYDIGEFWNNIVQDYIRKGELYGLTDGQIEFILEKSAAGKPGLAIRFAEKMLEEPPPPKPVQYRVDPNVEEMEDERMVNPIIRGYPKDPPPAYDPSVKVPPSPVQEDIVEEDATEFF